MAAAAEQTQFNLAAGAAVRIGVQEEGWYRVTAAQLAAYGFAANADPGTLQLYLNGASSP